MPCYHPIRAWRSRAGRTDNGAWPLVFDIRDGYADMEVVVPCGRCVGCRLERSRQWAVRCMHELKFHQDSMFLTLTYAPEHLPDDGGLHVEHFQNFMKRLRKHTKFKIRFLHCGEYGGDRGRPHYHAIIFGFDFPDKQLYKVTRTGETLYISETLNKLWGLGYCVIGAVTFESCAYVARYVLKKQTGDKALEHYVDPSTAVVRRPEYVTMSRRPGLGAKWFDKYRDEVLTHRSVLVNGHECSVPRYYEKRLEKENKQDYLKYKSQCAKIARDKAVSLDNSPDRLATREELQKLRIEQLPRPLDCSDSQLITAFGSYDELDGLEDSKK